MQGVFLKGEYNFYKKKPNLIAGMLTTLIVVFVVLLAVEPVFAEEKTEIKAESCSAVHIDSELNGPNGGSGAESMDIRESIHEEGSETIRLGYATLTPLHCALGEILDRTDILEKHGFVKGDFRRFPHGKDQDTACRNGLIDATFTCEVAAMVHLYRLPGLKLIGSPGSLGDIALLTRKGSSVKQVEDLDGGRIAVLGGSSARLMLGKWLYDAGVTQFDKLGIYLYGGDGEDAVCDLMNDKVDAVVLWDPWFTKAIRENKLIVLKSTPFWSLIAVYENRFSDDASERYLDAISDALQWGSEHFDEVVAWVSEISGIDRSILSVVLKKNRFLGKGEQASLSVDEEIRHRLNACESFAKRTSLIGRDFMLSERIDTSIAR